MIAFGMAAQTIPEYAEAGPVMGTFGMLINLLPGWLVAWLLAAFSAAMLSTIAVQVLTLATIFVKDIYVRYYNPNATDRQQSRYVRYAILFFAIGGIILSTALPPVNSAIVWLFSWLLPAFWMFVFGMFWKRSSRAAFYTLIISGVANTIWSFSSLPAYFNLEGNNNSIVMVVFSFTLGIILTAGDKNAKPGMVKMYLENKHEVVAPGRTGVLVEE
jgi:SSS family solute:Na+ symporter